jgi:hypothetical protein
VCTSQSRLAIEQELVKATPLRQIGKRFDLSAAALCRHNRAHLPTALVQAKDACDTARVNTILDDLHELEERARALGAKAIKAGDVRAALMAIREETRLLELRSKLVEAKGTGATVNENVTVNQLNILVERDPQLPIRAARAMLLTAGYEVSSGAASVPDAAQQTRLSENSST